MASGASPELLASKLAKMGAELDRERKMRKEADAANQALLAEANSLKADLGVAVEEGIRYREGLREWADFEESLLREERRSLPPASKELVEQSREISHLKTEVARLQRAYESAQEYATQLIEANKRSSERADVAVQDKKKAEIEGEGIASAARRMERERDSERELVAEAREEIARLREQAEAWKRAEGSTKEREAERERLQRITMQLQGELVGSMDREAALSAKVVSLEEEVARGKHQVAKLQSGVSDAERRVEVAKGELDR